MRDPRHLTTEIIPERVVRFLEARDADRPFCLSISFKAAHWPYTDFDPTLARLYEDETLPVAAAITPESAARVPDFLRASRSGRGMGLIEDPERRQNQLRNYYRLATGADLAVGKIRRALEERGLAEQTAILLTSDNGLLFGEHGLVGKWLMYEESIRVPLILMDPRLPAASRGSTCTEMALNIDVAPTLLDLAGSQPPASMQGQSLVPLLSDPRIPLRESWFYECHFAAGPTSIQPSEGVRERRWKYVRYLEPRPNVEQLFHLATDAHELRDLAGAPRHAATLERLRKSWFAYRSALH